MANFGSLGRRALLLGAATLLVASCLSPTLPLPPPSRPDVTSPDGAGFVRITGSVQSMATTYAQNMRTGRIAGQTTDETGDYELELAGEIGDRLVVWYTLNGDQSAGTEVIVPAPGPGPGLGGSGGAD